MVLGDVNKDVLFWQIEYKIINFIGRIREGMLEDNGEYPSKKWIDLWGFWDLCWMGEILLWLHKRLLKN